MPIIVLDTGPITYEIIENPRRKRFALEVQRDGAVAVRVPTCTDRATVERFIKHNAQWLLDRLEPERAARERKRHVRDGHGTIEYEIARNPRRKRVGIHIAPGGNVEVRAPVGVPERDIADIVRGRADWIRDNRAVLQARAARKKRYISGEEFMYRGELHTLRVEEGEADSETVQLEDGELVVRVPPELEADLRGRMVHRALRTWFIARALEVTEQRLPIFAEALDVQPAKVAIKDMKTQWGSCSTRGNISIGYRIVMAPPEVMDYLLVHELCHLIHPNHSAEFWRLVTETLPDQQARKRWLKQHERELVL